MTVSLNDTEEISEGEDVLCNQLRGKLRRFLCSKYQMEGCSERESRWESQLFVNFVEDSGEEQEGSDAKTREKLTS